MQAARYSAADLRAGGYKREEVAEAGYSLPDLVFAGIFPLTNPSATDEPECH
jgi:hypothetical protein